jgi:hypothetical protein
MKKKVFSFKKCKGGGKFMAVSLSFPAKPFNEKNLIKTRQGDT